MANTYVAIATTSLASQGTSIEFTNIPNTYTDLLVKFSLRSTEAATFTDGGFRVTFNGNGSGYYYLLLYGTGTQNGSVSSSNQANFRYMYGSAANATASTFSNGEIYIPNYLSSNNKSISSDSVSEQNAQDGGVLALTAGYWSNSSAITSVKLETNTGNWVVNSSATIYGIKSS